MLTRLIQIRSGHSVPWNMLSKHLKQMSEADLQDLNNELRREVQAQLRKTPKMKEAGSSDACDLL